MTNELFSSFSLLVTTALFCLSLSLLLFGMTMNTSGNQILLRRSTDRKRNEIELRCHLSKSTESFFSLLINLIKLRLISFKR